MKSINWSEIRWGSIMVNVVYVWVLGLGFAFLGRVMRFDEARDFVPLLTLVVALATVWVSYRVATRAGQQPIVHGFLVGLLVGVLGFVLNALTVSLSVVEVAGFLMQVLAGAMGGRMAQRQFIRE